MKDSWRAGISETNKTALVTEDTYQISRNSVFLGFVLRYICILLERKGTIYKIYFEQLLIV